MIHVIANRPSVCPALMVKAIDVTQVRYKPYATIERSDFSNALVFDNVAYIENYWMWASIWHTKTMLNLSFKSSIYWCDFWCCFLLNTCCLYILLTPKEGKPKIWMHIKHCLSSAKAIPIQEVQNCFVLMQLHLILKIFVCDAWLALWIIFEKCCSKIFGTTLQD